MESLDLSGDSKKESKSTIVDKTLYAMTLSVGLCIGNTSSNADNIKVPNEHTVQFH